MNKRSISYYPLILLIIFLHTCEKTAIKIDPVEPVYDTIFPKAYLPAYPGSHWTYLDQNDSTIISEVSGDYILDYYIEQEAAYISDTFYVPALNHIPLWGYEAHTGPISHGGSYPLTLVLNDTAEVGFSWSVAHWAGNENRRIILARDTMIQLSTNLTFSSVIVVKEYQSRPENVPEWWYKRYYAKDLGLIKEEYWFSYDSTYKSMDLLEYKINK